MKLLLDLGVLIEVMDSDNSTLLHRAAQGGHIDMVKLLLRKGSPIESVDNDTVETADRDSYLI